MDALANGGAVGRDAVEAVLADPRLIRPVFQPIVDLRTARVYAREALIRGRLGKAEVRGAELLEAAEAQARAEATEEVRV